MLDILEGYKYLKEWELKNNIFIRKTFIKIRYYLKKYTYMACQEAMIQKKLYVKNSGALNTFWKNWHLKSG